MAYIFTKLYNNYAISRFVITLYNDKKMDLKHWNTTESKLLTQEKEDTVKPHHLIAIVKHS